MFNLAGLYIASAEIMLAVLACVILLFGLFDMRGLMLHILSIITVCICGVFTAFMIGGRSGIFFSGHFVNDPLAMTLKLFAYILMVVVFIYSRTYLRDRGLRKVEYYVLSLFCLMGVMVMISANSLLTMYLGLELMSLCLYALVAFNRRSPRAAEAAMKYFVLGAMASAALLFGISITYGLTGTLIISELPLALKASGNIVLIGMALVFIVMAIAFKFGAVPFHMWVPDVYQGAPTAVTLLLGTVPKFAAFALVTRILLDGFMPFVEHWQDMLIVLAVLSIVFGNLVALAQTNIKRLLAYSTISHVGFIFLGFAAGTTAGFEAALFYTITYTITAAGAFGMVLLLSFKLREAESLTSFNGLGRSHPWAAVLMLVFVFSLAGVPPFVGFPAKLAVISAVLDQGYTWLAVLAVVMSVIGAFYYLRIIKHMYFDEPSETIELRKNIDMRGALCANAIAVLALGIVPGGLFTVCQRVFSLY